MAHYLKKYDPRITTWQGAVMNGWYFVRFCKALNNGVIRFSFWKKDGSIREAIGTTDLLVIPKDKRPEGVANKYTPNFSAICFFDLEKSEWRSFNIASFIGFVSIWGLNNVNKPVLKKADKRK